MSELDDLIRDDALKGQRIREMNEMRDQRWLDSQRDGGQHLADARQKWYDDQNSRDDEGLGYVHESLRLQSGNTPMPRAEPSAISDGFMRFILVGIFVFVGIFVIKSCINNSA